jgi:hypothetical protein
LNKAIVVCLSFLLVGCLVEEKHYHGCDADITCCMPEDVKEDVEEDIKEDIEDSDAKDFLDLFEEVSATK